MRGRSIVFGMIAAMGAAAFASGKPVVCVGDGEEVTAFQMDVATPAHVKVVRMDGKDATLRPSDYGTYAAIVLSAAAVADNEALRGYVEQGGTLIVSGDPRRQSRILGLEKVSICTNHVVRTDRGESWPWNFDKWNQRSTFGADAVAADVKVFARFAGAEGGEGSVAATGRRLGKGAAFWISPRLGLLRARFAWANIPLGSADEKGGIQLTPEGEALEALGAFFGRFFATAKDVDRNLDTSDWGKIPLGAPGDLKTETDFANKPTFRPAPVWPDAFAFVTADETGVVVASRGTEKLADELAWHIGEMCGKTPKIVPSAPSGVPTIALVLGNRPTDHSTAIRTAGKTLTIEGGTAVGVSHGVTYLLEALDCRYLWPGKTGKVIPKRATVMLPKIDFAFTPVLKCRELREYAKWNVDMSALGMDAKAFNEAFVKACVDREGNRGFYAWHGLNEPREMDGTYNWGHAFGDYYQRYHGTHPEWFALQPDGTRDQDLGSWTERPTFCLSDEGLAAAVASNLVARFKANPRIAALSICLPDGGRPLACMCSKCRALDPVNAPKISMYCYIPLRSSFPYVSHTDRVMTFNNRVAERVARECPGKRLCCYVYANYVEPPVKVKPHPSLVLLCVSGEYAGGADESQYGWARENLAAWSRFGNETLWRPNAFIGFRSPVPQNFARAMFNDLESFKANNLIGTDFDCNSHQWACRGLIYYAVAKGLVNPDALAYDVIYADYCRTGFGRAAREVRAYFDALEKLTRDAPKSGKGMDGYFKALDADRLDGILKAAVAAAGDDAAVRERLAFLGRGLAYARWEKRLWEAWKAKSPDREALRRDYIRFVRETTDADPVAVCPKWIVTPFYRAPYL